MLLLMLMQMPAVAEDAAREDALKRFDQSERRWCTSRAHLCSSGPIGLLPVKKDGAYSVPVRLLNGYQEANFSGVTETRNLIGSVDQIESCFNAMVLNAIEIVN